MWRSLIEKSAKDLGNLRRNRRFVNRDGRGVAFLDTFRLHLGKQPRGGHAGSFRQPRLSGPPVSVVIREAQAGARGNC